MPALLNASRNATRAVQPPASRLRPCDSPRRICDNSWRDIWGVDRGCLKSRERPRRGSPRLLTCRSRSRQPRRSVARSGKTSYIAVTGGDEAADGDRNRLVLPQHLTSYRLLRVVPRYTAKGPTAVSRLHHRHGAVVGVRPPTFYAASHSWAATL
jgi:hypothetical protein